MDDTQKQNIQGRNNGRYAKMVKCGVCGKRAALWPAFGGDSSHGANQTKWWGKNLCGKCDADASTWLHKQIVCERLEFYKK